LHTLAESEFNIKSYLTKDTKLINLLIGGVMHTRMILGFALIWLFLASIALIGTVKDKQARLLLSRKPVWGNMISSLVFAIISMYLGAVIASQLFCIAGLMFVSRIHIIIKTRREIINACRR
jgi:hypothetical protein